MLLDGMRIVSFCHFLQGPAATQYLGDMGAEVIKIEPPQGAYERHWAGADRAKIGGVSAFFLSANRNARSLAIDLKHPKAKAVIYRLIANSHVVVENFRPGTLDRLGFGYAAVKAAKPDIIYASASGFGATGPYADRPGQDLLIQAMSGLVAATGGRAGPMAAGCAAADQHGGALLALGILGAYAKWQRTGEGTLVEGNLLGAGVDLQTESLVTYYASGRGKEVFDRDAHLATWFHEAPYGVYEIADGHMVLSLNAPDKLATALKSQILRGFVGCNAYEERDAYAQAVATVLAPQRFADIAAQLDTQKLWFARVEDFDDLRQNPQLLHNEMFREVPVNDAMVTLVNHPLRYDGAVPGFRGFALQPGENTRAILDENGLTTEEVEELLRDGAVFSPEVAAE
ncbi:MAG: CoA transferase [Alphaproteobacteria bacterium]|nr:CoA transferase [Alphaproteobacteria bacterium]MBU0799338.1 CoA transferase [Alphaproteobacteria bacterium]MBU0888300.1 CoA transferase [Alphaproteobacteria bacterium]MBU1812869.1 CoA transferase [Alphaproteobacteria bacterium]